MHDASSSYLVKCTVRAHGRQMGINGVVPLYGAMLRPILLVVSVSQEHVQRNEMGGGGGEDVCENVVMC